MKVSELMSKDIEVLSERETVQKAIEIMSDKNCGLIAVLNNLTDRKVVGIFTNEDVISRVLAVNLDPKDIPVINVMTKEAISISSQATTSEAMELLMKNNIKRVLVMDEDQLVGKLSANDIICAMLKYKKNLLELALEF